jgi:hypothetical protein
MLLSEILSDCIERTVVARGAAKEFTPVDAKQPVMNSITGV